MQISGQLHSPAALHPALGGPQILWAFGGKKKNSRFLVLEFYSHNTQSSTLGSLSPPVNRLRLSSPESDITLLPLPPNGLTVEKL
jgi:hypothetical protein